MSLKNPMFRQLLRAIVAGLLEESKDAYKILYWKFGDKIAEAARYMWENRNTEPFKRIGGEEITNNTAKSIYARIKKYDENFVTMGGVFSLIDSDENYPVANLDMEEQTSLEYVRKTFKGMPAQLKNKLLEQKSPLSEQKLYEELNIAVKEMNYNTFLANNQAILNKEEKQPGAKAPTPTSPIGKLFGKSASVSIGVNSLEVLLNYIDSFEN